MIAVVVTPPAVCCWLAPLRTDARRPARPDSRGRGRPRGIRCRPSGSCRRTLVVVVVAVHDEVRAAVVERPPATGDVNVGPPPTPVLVGAGDVASCACRRRGDRRAQSGSPGRSSRRGRRLRPGSSRNCSRPAYGPAWGRFLDRSRPRAEGNRRLADEDSPATRGSTTTDPWRRGGTTGTRSTSVPGTSSCSTRSARGRRLRGRLAGRPMAQRRPRRIDGPLHARDLAQAALELGHARQRPGVSRPFWEQLYAAGADLGRQRP